MTNRSFARGLIKDYLSEDAILPDDMEKELESL